MARKNVERISSTIERLLAARGLASRLKEYRVLGRWDRAVGAVIARHARPQTIRGKRLAVVVDSSAWMQQLSLLKPEIIEKLNRALGEEAVETITLRIGEIDLPAAPGREPRPPDASLDAAEQRKVEEYVAVIADPEVRESFRRMIEKDLLTKKQRQR